MEAYRWDSTAEEPDRMERRMAEFLVRDFLAWEHVAGIEVMSQGEAKMVEGLLEGHHHRPEVVVRPGWCY
jgi:UDP-2,3-diacylglucosamine pyrophosphatase LpxH